MRIDSLKATPDRAGRFWVSFEDGSRMGLYRQTVQDFGLYSGKELSQEELERLKTAADSMSARMRAVRIVSMSNVSRKDLQERLVRKGEDPEQARQAVEWMEQMRLVDDRSTAESIVHSCIAKGYGKARAKQALYEKRIPREYWEDALADYPDQQEKIQSFLRSRLGSTPEPKEVKRAVDALLRRGHSYSAIRQALNEIQLEASEEILEE